MKQLTIYKASAGSGKTFTLATEYMSMVIANPQAYRTILAVTFTNKATEEMKQRILSQLYALAYLPLEGNCYLKKIQETTGLSDSQIQANAASALRNLIHNYSYFRVETIDSFFQSVFRNLARELDLTANLRIGLNDTQVMQNAVDELIESLETHDKLLGWIMEYIKENIADDKSWNVISQIKDFGRNIFKDFYKEHADTIAQHTDDEEFFKTYKNRLYAMRKQAESEINKKAEEFFSIVEEHGLTAEDFASKQRGIWGYFEKLRKGKIDDKEVRTKTVERCCEESEAWVTKTHAKTGDPVFDLVNSSLRPLLCQSEQTRIQHIRVIKSVSLTVKHLNKLRLLSSIDKKVREMNEESNRFLLSDTQSLLHSLIQDNDSPFVFEKIGTQLEHIMIDEFQDTSKIQWQNFKVLLEETMSHEHPRNIIVGDVKQSIYRWRSGDWRLLNNITEQFTNGAACLEFPPALSTNYRSEANIITFNNAFFQAATRLEVNALISLQGSDEKEAEIAARQVEQAYHDVKQGISNQKEANPQGFVRVQLITGKDDKERLLEQTLQTVEELKSRGVSYQNMAILVRSNKTIQDIATYFMNHSDIPLISDEAFRLDASQAVNALVTALYFLIHPEDNIVEATLKKFAREYCTGEKVVSILKEQRNQLLCTPLYDLTETIFQLFHMDDNAELQQQNAYICAFYDQLSKFLTDHSGDISAFLAEWESSIHEKSIHSDISNGIRLITIHKSKGLEFENVIMPFFDWALEKSNILWCTPNEEPFSQLPLVPVDFNKKQMLNSIYEKDYYQEHLQNVVDNLNLLYVAFTRPEKRMFILGKRGGENLRSKVIEDSLVAMSQSLDGLRQTGDEQKKDDELLFEFGIMEDELPTVFQQQISSSMPQNVFTKSSKGININICVNATLPEFRQSNQSKDFIEGDEAEEQQKFYIKMGTVLHHLFSTIQTTADINKALKDLEESGVLYDENVSHERIEKMIRKRFENPKVQDWFSDHWTVQNECSILSVENGKVKEHRPDRVMKDDKETIIVDFKFGSPKPEHQQQVAQYMQLLKDMGEKSITGYLWYVYPNKIEEVHL